MSDFHSYRPRPGWNRKGISTSKKRSKTPNACRKGKKTLSKRKPCVLKSTNTSSFRKERFRFSMQLRSSKKIRECAAAEALLHLQGLINERRATQRINENFAVKKIQRFLRTVCKKPSVTVALENWSSAQDMLPYTVSTPSCVWGFGVDGHGMFGGRLRDKVVALPKSFKDMSKDDPIAFVERLKEECKEEHGGGMVTSFSAKQTIDGWTVKTGSRGDYAFWAIIPDGTVHEIKYHLPDIDNLATPGYTIKPGNTLKFEMTPENKIAISRRNQRAVYAKCIESKAEIAAFAGIGDSRTVFGSKKYSFYNVPSFGEEWNIPSGSRLILCSDGVRDVMHSKDPFFRQSDLTAEMVIDEAKARWQTRPYEAVCLDKYLAKQENTRMCCS
jgi:hypothetical protein